MSNLIEALKQRAKEMAEKTADMLKAPLPKIGSVPDVGNTFDVVLEGLEKNAEELATVIGQIDDQIKVLETAKDIRETLSDDLEALIQSIKDTKEDEQFVYNQY